MEKGDSAPYERMLSLIGMLRERKSEGSTFEELHRSPHR